MSTGRLTPGLALGDGRGGGVKSARCMVKQGLPCGLCMDYLGVGLGGGGSGGHAMLH